MTDSAGTVHVGAVHVGWAVPRPGSAYAFQRRQDAPPDLADVARRTLARLQTLPAAKSLSVRSPGFTLSVHFGPSARQDFDQASRFEEGR